MNTFQFDAKAASTYAERPPRIVPGYSSLHTMVSQLLAERVPEDGRILILGAGGGLEIKALADEQSGWSFDGVDPSADMLHLAEKIVEEHASRVSLQEGYINSAPEGPFDAATALLTFHFISRDQRLETLQQIHSRLRRGAPLALAHLSFTQSEPERSLWIDRHVAYATRDSDEVDHVERVREAIDSELTILEPAEDEAMLREAGFSNVSLFYAGLALRGWVAYAE